MYKTRTVNIDMFYGASPEIQKRAIALRKNMTVSEKLLWNKLSSNQLKGYKFRRQHPIDIFIADFYCHKARLVIEIDGEIHNNPDNMEYDEGRSYEISKFDIKIIRFTNNQIINEIESVIEEILGVLPPK